MELRKIQSDIAKVCHTNKWDKRTNLEVFLLLSEELGELAKEIRLHSGIKNEKIPESKDNLAHEFADVFNYFLDLANRFDIDLTDAYYQKQEINKHRTWS